MTFIIDKFFIQEFNEHYNTNLDYKEFVEFHKATRLKKKSLGLVQHSSRDRELTLEELELYNKLVEESRKKASQIKAKPLHHDK